MLWLFLILGYSNPFRRRFTISLWGNWMKRTLTILPGNTDHKLSQVEWHDYVLEIGGLIDSWSQNVWFFGAPANFGPKGLGLINAIALLGLIPVLGYISTYFYRRTGKVYVGAFINTFFIAWYLVAANTVQGF